MEDCKSKIYLLASDIYDKIEQRYNSLGGGLSIKSEKGIFEVFFKLLFEDSNKLEELADKLSRPFIGEQSHVILHAVSQSSLGNEKQTLYTFSICPDDKAENPDACLISALEKVLEIIDSS